ncbi:hypothetical protein GOODEAATRI_019055 [Goodea atripinnis]|uniref:BOS complex subunit TMEM147 n=1 Tax=Goodea atripinnis TaxID=208336 RepID=A0ABV0N3G7_9TELE
MGRKGCPELMLLLLFNAVVWMEAMVIKTIYFHAQKLTWTEARQYCQRMYIDMLTWDTTDMDQVTKWLVEINYHDVWIGLRRDPEQPLVWRWINVKTGEGLTGEDVSESENWATSPQPNVSCLDRIAISGRRVVVVRWRDVGPPRDAARLPEPVGTLTGKGLTGEDVSQSKNWATGQQFKDRCGSYNSFLKKWYSKNCTKRLYFSCYEDNLVLVTENKTSSHHPPVFQMLFLATFFPTWEGGAGVYDFVGVSSKMFTEFMKSTVDLADLLGLHLVMSRNAGKGEYKIMVAAMGWATAELVMSRFLPLWVGARGIEFDWKYIQMSFDSNISLVHYIAMAAVVWMFTRYDLPKSFRLPVTVLLALCVYKAFLIELFVHVFLLGSWTVLLVKAVLTGAISLCSLFLFVTLVHSN